MSLTGTSELMILDRFETFFAKIGLLTGGIFSQSVFIIFSDVNSSKYLLLLTSSLALPNPPPSFVCFVAGSHRDGFLKNNLPYSDLVGHSDDNSLSPSPSFFVLSSF
jgi:hypothetical protein